MNSEPFLVVGAAVMLSCLISTSFVIIRGEKRQRNLKRRFYRVTVDLTTQLPDVAPDWRDEFAHYKTFFLRSLTIFNIDINRAPDYPVPWWLALLAAWLFTRATIAVLAMLVGGPIIIIWPVIGLILSRVIFGSFHRRRASSLFKQFPDTLGTIVRCVRVGIPVQESLRVVSRDMPEPTAQEFSRLADKVAIGVSLETALHELADRNQLAEYKFFATALSLQARTGGPLAQTLETLADVIRKRVAMRARGYALAAEARTSALILGFLPVFAGVAIWLIQPSYIDSLFTNAFGHKIFAAAVALLSFGAFIMRVIIQRSLS